jgi:protoporphyrinogen oxidase
MTNKKVIRIGAGPVGLTAGYKLLKHGVRATIVRADDIAGGLARTVNYRGYLFDFGEPRFFTPWDEVNRLWQDIRGDAFVVREWLSRIPE